MTKKKKQKKPKTHLIHEKCYCCNINISHKWSPSRPHCTEQRLPVSEAGRIWGNYQKQELCMPWGWTIRTNHKPWDNIKKRQRKQHLQTVIAHLCTYCDSRCRPHTTCTWAAQSLEGQMVASMPHGWGRACAQELRGEARLSPPWRGAREKRALGGKERVGGVWAAAQIPAPNPSIPTLLV